MFVNVMKQLNWFLNIVTFFRGKNSNTRVFQCGVKILCTGDALENQVCYCEVSYELRQA